MKLSEIKKIIDMEWYNLAIYLQIDAQDEHRETCIMIRSEYQYEQFIKWFGDIDITELQPDTCCFVCISQIKNMTSYEVVKKRDEYYFDIYEEDAHL